MARSYDAARSAVRRSVSASPSSRTAYRSAVFTPENEKSRSGNARDGERERLGVARSSETVERDAARVAEAEEPRPLVERLTGRVVEGRAEPLRAAALSDEEQERMAAAREQADERRLERVVAEVERCDVPVEVVDRDERRPRAPRDRLRRRDADEEGADKPGALGDRDPVDVVERDLRTRERLAHDRSDELQVAPRGDLGDHPAVAVVELRLGGDDGRSDLALVGDDRRSGLVAGRLEREDHEAASRPSSTDGSRHMISASSRLSV